MNLEESHSFIEEEAKQSRKRRSIVFSMGICAVLVVILFCLIIYIKQQDAKTLKMFINGNQVGISSTLFRNVDGVQYINIKEIAQTLGYSYTQGEYEKYSEEETSCYIANDYEIVALTSDAQNFTKYAENTAVKPVIAGFQISFKSEKGSSQKYILKNPIKYIDNSIYVPFESLTDMINVQIDLSQPNRIKLSNLEQVVLNGKNRVGQLKYPIVSVDYENLKAMLYGYAVVSDNSHYGVISLTTGETIIGLKYDDITFTPNLQNFMVKATNTVGILGADGSIIIKPKEYDEIRVFDEENRLYEVEKDGKLGILNKTGEVIIYADYDEVGYEKAKELEMPAKTGNYKVIFNSAIIVKEGSKYGMYDLDGNELLLRSYDGFMCEPSKSKNSVAGEKTVFVIPETVGIRGVVINQNDSYGIYDVETKKIIIPCVCSKVYYMTREGKTTYYLEYDGMTLELEQYLKDNNLVSVTEPEAFEESEIMPDENVIETSNEPVVDVVETPESDLTVNDPVVTE